MKELRSFHGKESHRPGEERCEASKALEVGFGAATDRESRTPTPSPLVHHVAVGLQNLCAWSRLEVLGLTVGGCALALVIKVGLVLEAGGN